MKKITRLFDLLDLYRDEFANKPDALLKKRNDEWIPFSSEDYIDYVDKLSLGLLELGLTRGSKIASVVRNSPEWNFIDMACLQTGVIQIPIYPTISQNNYRYIFNDANVEYVFVYDEEIYNRIKGVIDSSGSIKEVYSIEEVAGVKSWDEILQMGAKSNKQDELKKIKDSIQTNDIATLIYTSGTTGFPKGVMLSHANLISNYQGAATIPNYEKDDRALSFLPLCHIYERTVNYTFQSFGMSIYYVERIDQLGVLIREVKPHSFGAVPRVLEKTFDKIVRAGRNLKGFKKVIFFWALDLGYKFELNRANGWWYEFQLKIADKLVFKKWREALGNHIKIIVSGGASLQPRIARVFYAARILVMEGYGLTETSPVIAVSRMEKNGYMFGTVGPALPGGVEIKIADDGEILTRGPGLMLGYYNKPEETKAVIDEEGWFHTGDIGHLEEGRFLRITDRKKEIFKTSGGKYVAPQIVENTYKESPFIDNIIVIGEGRNFCSGLIVPNFEHLESWCEVKGHEYTGPVSIIKNEIIINRIQREVTEISSELDHTEQIKKFILVADEWGVESGELSPTLKLRRKEIHARYKKLIEKMYTK